MPFRRASGPTAVPYCNYSQLTRRRLCIFGICKGEGIIFRRKHFSCWPAQGYRGPFSKERPIRDRKTSKLPETIRGGDLSHGRNARSGAGKRRDAPYASGGARGTGSAPYPNAPCS